MRDRLPMTISVFIYAENARVHAMVRFGCSSERVGIVETCNWKNRNATN